MTTEFETKNWYKDRDLLLKLVLFFSLVVVTIYRQPELLIQPRFWAEEGRNYFSYAFNHSFLQNLFHPQFGYNTFYHSIVTSIATLSSLEYAPLVTTWAAFLIQILVGYLVLWGDILLLNTVTKRAFLLFLIPLLCYARNWLNTIGVQYWLCIVSFLILNEAPDGGGRFRTISRGFLLTLSGLTGVTSCFMTPVFLLKAIRSRSRQFSIYTIILAICSCMQVSVFVYNYLNRDAGVGMRFVYNNPMHLLSKVLMFQFAEPFLGHWFFQLPLVFNLGEYINNSIISIFGTTVFRSGMDVMGDLLGACFLIFVVYLFFRKLRDPDYLYVTIAFTFVFVFSTLLSVNMSAGPRYTFAPNAMIILFMAAMWNDQKMKISRQLIRIFLALSLLIHTVEFRASMENFAYSSGWPKWETEVQQWRTDPSYRLKIWPLDWEMTLQLSPLSTPKEKK